MKRVRFLFWLGILAVVPAALSQVREYAIILQDPPVARQIQSRHELKLESARQADSRIEEAQARIRQQLASRNVRVITSTKTLLNAIFVVAGPDEAAALQSLPGVIRVAPLRKAKLHLNAALPLIKVPGAWAALAGAGISDPGAGIKIAIIDTGIDQTHPGFQDPSMSMPPGFPLCSGTDCNYTNSKVIVARSYVWMTAVGSGPSDSRPDDLSPRDHVGHGTATAMVAAGVQHAGPLATISGVAPKAYLGNYKVFGSPYINDGATSSSIIKALDDAFNDGMDIASLSLGFPAWFGPLDKGADCGALDPNAPCEVEANAVETAVSRGMIVVASAGNDGDAGLNRPTLSTVATPGIAPSAITAGASRNAHNFYSTVSVTDSGAPPTVTDLPGMFGNGPLPDTVLTAPLLDVNGLACSALAPNAVSGAIALIQRGQCYFYNKVLNAQAAGAVGVIFYCEDSQYCTDGGETPFPPGVAGTSIPSMLIGTTSGRALKSYVQAHPNAHVTMDPTVHEYSDPNVDTVAAFSSRGPSIAPETAIKPEVAGIGTSVYMATQNYDTNGDMYNPSRYTVAEGTSFSGPMAAGVAALVKQKNPNLTPAEIKSAIVNTASQTVTDGGAEARVIAVGAGKLDALAAVQSNVFVDPPTLSFGSVTVALMGSTKRLTVTNNSGSAVTLAVVPRDADPNAHLTLSSATVPANSMQAIAVTLAGSMPSTGSYEGVITLTGGAVDLHVPFYYAAGTGVINDLVPVTGTLVSGTVGQPIPGLAVAIRAVDQYGLSVEGSPVGWTTSGGPQIGFSGCGWNSQTYDRGVAAACIQAGASPTTQTVTAMAGGLQMTFTINPRLQPVVSKNSSGQLGVTNGASFNTTNGGSPALSPGSYITIFGANLADTGVQAWFDQYLPPAFVYLPLALAGVSVTFDVSSQGISAPGHLSYVAPGQINVQVPFELQGQSTASMKIRVGNTVSSVYTIQLADAAPGIFENDPYGTGQAWAAAQHADTYAPVGPSQPAQKSEWLLIYATGLGPVYNQPASGEPAPYNPLANAKLPVSVTIGGQPVKSIYYAGLTPSYMGLYQVNVQVADNTPSGRQPVIVTANGNSSKAAYVSMQ